MQIKTYLFFVLFSLVAMTMYGQNQQLAIQYYNSGEYEKAGDVYLSLYNKNPRQYSYFNRYVDCLIQAQDFQGAEKSIKAEIKKKPNDAGLLILLGQLYQRQGQDKKGLEYFERAISAMEGTPQSISRVGNAFHMAKDYKRALEVYEKGGRLMNDTMYFVSVLQNLSRLSGDKEKQIQYSLLSLVKNPKSIESTKRSFQASLVEEDYPKLQKRIYSYLKSYPDEIVFPELLEWTFIHQKKYDKALRQAKALDKRLDENGNRVYKLGTIAKRHGDLKTALKAFDYIVENKSENSNFGMSARLEKVRIKKALILKNETMTAGALDTLENELSFLVDKYAARGQGFNVMMELAEFQNTELKDTDKSIATLKRLIHSPGILPKPLARAKLMLGDLYLLKGERWESTLLYAQVDKDFPEEQIGEDARFRNAMLSYFVGDFEWAQSQFDILKASTSKLISNDAIDRSVFIMENMGLDTTDVPLSKFAHAELLIFQRRQLEAFDVFDDLLLDYPEHELEDDIYYTKAVALEELGELEKAIELYKRVEENYTEDIRADNAIYALAQIYEATDQIDLAVAKYEKIFIEFNASTFAIEARKRYRELKAL